MTKGAKINQRTKKHSHAEEQRDRNGSLQTSTRNFGRPSSLCGASFRKGTGFIVDSSGLILTNQHILGPTSYIAVQFDTNTKVPATKLLADPEKNVAPGGCWHPMVRFAVMLPI
jgi:S1-C subfamily serine protease